MSIDAGHPGIPWTSQLRARIDGALIEFHSTADTGWYLFTRSSALFPEGSTSMMSFTLNMEDVAPVTDGTWHSLATTVTSAGSKIFLDGYQCFSTTADLPPAVSGPEATLEFTSGAGIDIRSFTEHDGVLSPAEALALSSAPTPLIGFVAARLSDYDVVELFELTTDMIFARYRVRGSGQHGTALAVGGGGVEQLNPSVTEEGTECKVLERRGEWHTSTAHGHWDQGYWHDVVVRVGHGAVWIYVDGYLEAHLPGQAFFTAVDSPDEVVIGWDTSESRLFDEVHNTAFYSSVLNDLQIKKLSSIAPVDMQCSLGAGFHNSISYCILLLITLEFGTVVAGVDQREIITNDSLNSINFTVRRSSGGGHTWGDLQTALTHPGHGAKGASVIDSYVVWNRRSGRLVILIDHFPGGTGQPNAEAGLGVGERGRHILHDTNGATYTWNQDGSITDADGNTIAFTVPKRGDVTVTKGGQESSDGNVFFTDGIGPHQALLMARTCFLQVIYSNDNGETWSGSFNLNQDVKEGWMPFCRTSPGTGAQLRSGRLVILIYYNGDHKRHFPAPVVYPNDGGTTWKCGKSPNDGHIFEGHEIDSCMLDIEAAVTHEVTLIERADSSFLMPMRNQHSSGKIATTVSTDGGETWSDMFFAEEITEIFCRPNAVPWPTEDCPERVVFANASRMHPYRGRSVLRLSEDGGRTWIASRTFNPAYYVYQYMMILPDGALGSLWEREMQGLYFSHIPLERIEAAKI